MLTPIQLTPEIVDKLFQYNANVRQMPALQILDRILHEKKTDAEQRSTIIAEAEHLRSSQLSDYLNKKMSLSEDETVAVSCAVLGVPYYSLVNFVPEDTALKQISQETAERYGLIPVALHQGKLLVALRKPDDQNALNAVRFESSYAILPMVAPRREIFAAIDRSYASTKIDILIDSIADGLNMHSSSTSDEQLERLANQQPMVRLVNSIIRSGIKNRASDINIRPEKSETVIYFRIDGQMIPFHRLNIELLNPLVARVKIVGDMDVVERRIPQDGHAHMNYLGRQVDLRISAMPTVLGESVVIRLLNTDTPIHAVKDLGLMPEQLRVFQRLTSSNNGICLITGPTGSGKSTTLYALLNERKKNPRHIITIEDPVEYQIEGIEQININSKIGYTFARAMRNILRHDPDDILVGEMRDYETAEIAISAALTGHFVMSTLHTNDAPSSITRLIEMGIEPYLVSSSVVGVLAQRLLRRLCTACRKPYQESAEHLAAVGIEPSVELYKPGGCSACNHTGFKGRLMVCEILEITPRVRQLITENTPALEIRRQAVEEGMVPMWVHAADFVRRGMTTVQEAMIAKVEM